MQSVNFFGGNLIFFGNKVGISKLKHNIRKRKVNLILFCHFIPSFLAC